MYVHHHTHTMFNMHVPKKKPSLRTVMLSTHILPEVYFQHNHTSHTLHAKTQFEIRNFALAACVLTACALVQRVPRPRLLESTERVGTPSGGAIRGAADFVVRVRNSFVPIVQYVRVGMRITIHVADTSSYRGRRKRR